MRKIDVVITMGGLGSRFRKMGYTIPKYMIEAKGRTLFEWSMASLEGYSRNVSKYIFIVMRDESVDVEGFIEKQCKKIGLLRYHVIVLDYLTDGQATTASLAEKYWNPDHSLLIYNIDTYVETGEMSSSALKGDGFIPCFQAEGEHWSFVRLDETGRVTEIKEKKRISNYCTLGAYYFKTCRLYKSLYDEFYSSEQGVINGEKYVAPLYDYLLSKGGEVYISDIAAEKVHVLGTPEELQAFLECTYLGTESRMASRLLSNRIFRFWAVGGCSTGIDFIIYMFLSTKMHITAAKGISMVIASIFSYFVNKRFTFHNMEKTNLGYLIRFYIVFAANFGVNLGVNFLIFHNTGDRIFSFILAVICGMTVNYFGQKFFVFGLRE